jgi:uncharacterized protein
LSVRFAAHYESADELIEELILADSSPRRLTVVSSDHRLHRAARRRHARPIDSDRWYSDMLRRRQGRQRSDMPQVSKPAGPPTANDVDFWLKQFTGDATPNDEIFPPGYGEGEEES